METFIYDTWSSNTYMMDGLMSIIEDWSKEKLKGLHPYCKYIPDLTPSPELSYLLGVRYGDMGLYGDELYRHKLVRLKVIDYDFAEEFARCLGIVMNLKIEINSNWEPPYFIAQIDSKVLYLFFTELDLYDHAVWIEEYPADALRGFFDSEGNASLVRDSFPQVLVKLTDEDVLYYASSLLNLYFNISATVTTPPSAIRNVGRVCGYNQRGVPIIVRKVCHMLYITNLDDVEKFLHEIGFSIARKNETLAVGLYLVPHPRWTSKYIEDNLQE